MDQLWVTLACWHNQICPFTAIRHSPSMSQWRLCLQTISPWPFHQLPRAMHPWDAVQSRWRKWSLPLMVSNHFWSINWVSVVVHDLLHVPFTYLAQYFTTILMYPFHRLCPDCSSSLLHEANCRNTIQYLSGTPVQPLLPSYTEQTWPGPAPIGYVNGQPILVGKVNLLQSISV
jgi:hypothetical protein